MTKIENIKWLEGCKNGLGVFTVVHGRKRHSGILNTTGKIVVGPIDPASYKYQRLNIIDEQTAFLQQYLGRGRILDIASNRFYPSAFSKCGDKLTTYKTGKGYGLSDIDGRTIIPHRYCSLVFADKDGKYLVARNRKNKYGILASDGSVSLPFEFDNISVDNKNPLPVSIPVEQAGKWFLVSTSTWQRLEDNKHDWIGCISPDGYAIIEEITKYENESIRKYGLIDCYGTILIPAEYDSMRELGSGRWAYEKFNDAIANVKHGVVDCFNNKQLPEYEYCGTDAFVSDFHKDRYIVYDNRPKRFYHGHIGVVAENGRIILPFRFSSLSRFGVYIECWMPIPDLWGYTPRMVMKFYHALIGTSASVIHSILYLSGKTTNGIT